MTLTDYYNRFMKMAQYSRAGMIDTSSLISKFKTHLRPLIFEMMVARQFNSLVDYYAATLLVETNLDMRNAKRARACGHGGNDSRKIIHCGGGGGWQ